MAHYVDDATLTSRDLHHSTGRDPLFAYGGGVFIPLSQFSPLLQTMAAFTPLYGLSQLVHYPLTGGSFDWVWAINLVAWLQIFVVGTVWRFRRDTARV